MFLFSTTFYPLDVYPPAIAAVVRCLPLYQGIELMRGLCLGIVSASLLWHVLYFLVMAAVGILVTSRRLDRLLLR
jgi:lipooligosaccharide transport system permease protein